MKISREQVEQAVEYALKKRGGKSKGSEIITEKELELLVEILKNMPEEAVRHLDYSRIKENMGKISENDIAEKILLREIVDKLLGKSG
jgi:hypothetical protein